MAVNQQGLDQNDPNYYQNLQQFGRGTGNSSGNTGIVDPTQTAGQTPQQVPGTPTGTPEAFIAQYQQTHPQADLNGLLAALKAAGYQNVDHFMYGSTPSGNELSINGQKYKVVSGENSGSPSWYTAGTNDLPGGGSAPAGGTLGSLGAGGFDPSDPSYQFRLSQGLQGIDTGAAARGTLLTMGNQKNRADYASNLASQEYGAQFGRGLSLAQLGLGAAENANAAGSGYASGVGGVQTDQGNAGAAGTTATGVNNSGFVNNATNAAQQAALSAWNRAPNVGAGTGNTPTGPDMSAPAYDDGQ